MKIKIIIFKLDTIFYEYTIFDNSLDAVFADAKATYPEATRIVMELGL